MVETSELNERKLSGARREGALHTHIEQSQVEL